MFSVVLLTGNKTDEEVHVYAPLVKIFFEKRRQNPVCVCLCGGCVHVLTAQ